ncbi:MAG: pitrilysin family protein [Spirosomataceae bacterium]
MSLDRTLAPDFQTIETVSIPPLQTYLLDNGLPVHVVNIGEQPVMRLELVANAGSWYETLPGVSYFTIKMLGEGTSRHSSKQISEFFDQYGAFTDYVHGMDRAGFTLFGLTKHLAQLLPMVQELLTEAIFPEKELANLKRITEQNLQVNLEKTAYVATQTFRRKLFGSSHPYGRSMDMDMIDSVYKEDLLEYYQQFIKGAPFTIFLSGKISEAEVALLNQYLGVLPVLARNQVVNHSVASSFPSAELVEKDASLQSSIRLGKPFITRHHPDFCKAVVLNEVLGGYFGSRLMKNIREEKGFTYGISSQLVSLSKGAYWVVGTDVKREFTSQTVDEIYKEIKRLQTELVPADELETVKNFLSGEFAGSLNTPFEIMDRHKIIMLEQLPSDFYNVFLPTIRQVSAEDVLQMANELLALDSLHEVVVGGK